jgi:hypothetical protein
MCYSVVNCIHFRKGKSGPVARHGGALEGEEVWFLLFLNLGTRGGRVVSIMPCIMAICHFLISDLRDNEIWLLVVSSIVISICCP